MEIIDREKMKDIAVYGAGGFGREVQSLIEQLNANELTYNFVGFLMMESRKVN